jgi:hypothetical protein
MQMGLPSSMLLQNLYTNGRLSAHSLAMKACLQSHAQE